MFIDAIMNTQRRVMSRFSLPARSLRGRPASLRTVPDGAEDLLRKRLIWRALLVIRPAISDVESIFLPALRERGRGLLTGVGGSSLSALAADDDLVSQPVLDQPAGDRVEPRQAERIVVGM
jgi:hypothetical protein